MTTADKLTRIAENQQKVYEAGQAAGGGDGYYDTFWDSFQQNGDRTNYQYGFASSVSSPWVKTNFNPKYSMRPTSINTGFHSFGQAYNVDDGIDFVEVFDNRGLVFDTSNCTNFISAFMWAVIKRLGVIDVRKDTSNLNATFGYGKIKTIDKLIVNENNDFTSAFIQQTGLENITFEGVIGRNISFAQSMLLSDASVQSVIDHLKDLTGATANTFTLHATVGAKLTEAQKAAITAKNWTLVY